MTFPHQRCIIISRIRRSLGTAWISIFLQISIFMRQRMMEYPYILPLTVQATNGNWKKERLTTSLYGLTQMMPVAVSIPDGL